MGLIVYMFHAIGEIADDDWADPHYGYEKIKFEEFLASIGKIQSLRAANDNQNKTIPVVTFDDGHISNYYAAKYIKDNDFGTADFFINPEKVGSPYYMTWDEIRHLHQWGMSIQSHGLDHKYLSDCDDVELHRQLLKSKLMIEEAVDTKVTILAPPGGRYDNRVMTLSKKMGYQFIANSAPGGLKSFDDYLVPRYAVLKSHSITDLLSLNKTNNLLAFKIKSKYMVLLIIKKILGNKQYDKFRWLILGEQ